MKAALQRVLPGRVVRAGSWVLDRTLPSRRATLAREELAARHRRLAADLVERHGPVVQDGPFAGLKLASADFAALVPTLVGSYEAELHAELEQLVAAAPKRIVNVGCAEGYYAVGLAQRVPGAHVWAFDIDASSQAACRETAELNGVAERVTVGGACGTEELEELAGPDALLVIDCEGCETALLHPDRMPSLREAVLLVELHDFVDPGISTTVLERFRPSHSAQVIDVQAREDARYAALAGLSRRDRAAAMNERRPTEPHPMQWVVLRPR